MAKASVEFKVFVKPTGSICNLDCHYCYYLKNEELYFLNFSTFPSIFSTCSKIIKKLISLAHLVDFQFIYPYIWQSWNNLINLYEALNKPEEAEKWQAKLAQIEDFKK